MLNGRIYRKGSAWILSYAVKAQEPDGKITRARRSKRLAPYGDDLCEGLDVDLAFPESAAEGERAAAAV
jgi:hypothetical protein